LWKALGLEGLFHFLGVEAVPGLEEETHFPPGDISLNRRLLYPR
jgi:hypothetical protein